jgi:hypothetical protein
MKAQSDMQQAEREIRAWLTDCTPAGVAMEGLMDAYLGRTEAERTAFVAAMVGRLTISAHICPRFHRQASEADANSLPAPPAAAAPDSGGALPAKVDMSRIRHAPRLARLRWGRAPKIVGASQFHWEASHDRHGNGAARAF